jgi:hypothetical protein
MCQIKKKSLANIDSYSVSVKLYILIAKFLLAEMSLPDTYLAPLGRTKLNGNSKEYPSPIFPRDVSYSRIVLHGMLTAPQE